MPSPEKAVPLSTRLGLSASAGCVASSCCHPLDVIRIQMQTGTGYKNPVDAAVHIFQRTGGIRNFYEGLSAAYLRQFTYTAFRMGTFSYLLDVVKGQSEGEVSLTTKLLVGAIAGITGSIIGNPAELSLVRMGNDSKLPMDQRRNYKSSIHACIEVVEKMPCWCPNMVEHWEPEYHQRRRRRTSLAEETTRNQNRQSGSFSMRFVPCATWKVRRAVTTWGTSNGRTSEGSMAWS